MQAITTRYHGPTNVRGSRIKATAAAGSITLGYDHALTLDGNHEAAAKALANKFGWLDHCRLEYGTDHKGDGQHVLVRK